VTPLQALLDELSVRDEALALGSGHSVVAEGLVRSGVAVAVAKGDWPSVQLPRRYPLVVVEPPTGSDDVEGSPIVRYERTDRVTIHDRVFTARTRIRRVTPHELAAQLLLERGGPTVVDTRTATDRGRFGVIAGSIHVPRTLVEWHLDPANGYRHSDVTSFDQPLVLVCNGGYSSSLAAENLLDLGFTDVGDLVGGIRAWTAAGFEVVEPDHSHLDL
jgi:rhodanese-related sulfurtransferase